MNLRIHLLVLEFKESIERIPFRRFSYFYGQIGAGKTSMARLIDYCLGGRFTEYTSALQQEFVSASLHLTIGTIPLELRRDRDSDRVVATWLSDGQEKALALPARRAAGEVLPGTGVEVLSDLIFYLAGLPIARVRRSKVNDQSPLERLSFRDLWNFCYLDQDDMDSNFFDLDGEAEFKKRLKARDVLRYILGYHQEHISELEARLDDVRQGRNVLEASSEALRQALLEVGVTSVADLQKQMEVLDEAISRYKAEIERVRAQTFPAGPHEADRLREQARELFSEIGELEREIDEVRIVQKRDEHHLNDLKGLSFKFKRDRSARAVLGSVEFSHCPRCTQPLPPRDADQCTVCGQAEAREAPPATEEVVEADLKLRVNELSEMVEKHRAALRRLEGDLRLAQQEKVFVDQQINDAVRTYDSQYLSQHLDLERQLAAAERQRLDIERLGRLPKVIEDNAQKVGILIADEKALREALKEARALAEKDTRNLKKLRELFLDCLLRSKLSGFQEDDVVTFQAPDFFPRVASAEADGIAFNSFSNLLSGGKKTLFKCCFAVALHRLATAVNAPLPKILLLDSPMKNISERENKPQFEGFHDLIYDLAIGELKDTQFIFVDKEYKLPPEGFDESDFYLRHMTPDQLDAPPLIPYYRGK